LLKWLLRSIELIFVINDPHAPVFPSNDQLLIQIFQRNCIYVLKNGLSLQMTRKEVVNADLLNNFYQCDCPFGIASRPGGAHHENGCEACADGSRAG
jgi:hypothetical protein